MSELYQTIYLQNYPEANTGNLAQEHIIGATGDLVAKPCEIIVPIALKIPIDEESLVVATSPVCSNGYSNGRTNGQANQSQEDVIESPAV